MVENDKECATWAYIATSDANCNNNADWQLVKSCQVTCGLLGKGYGETCCQSTPAPTPPTPPPFSHLEPIKVRGYKYTSTIASQSATQFQRFRDTLYSTGEWISGVGGANALTTTGGALVFESNSNQVTLKFVWNSAHGSVNQNSHFRVMQNGVRWRDVYVGKSATNLDMAITSQHQGEYVRYEVIMPSWSNPLFRGVTQGSLRTFEMPETSVYVALGDSISHGSGQASKTYETYPWQVASTLNAELFNLAVGGGKVSNMIAEQLEDWNNIDILTSLVGFNDWYYNGKTTETYIADYRGMLATVRRSHPTTPIFVMNCLYTTASVSPKTGIRFDAFRVGLRDMVAGMQSEGDVNVYLVPSDTWMNSSDLADTVHLSPSGAAKLASRLSDFISAQLGN